MEDLEEGVKVGCRVLDVLQFLEDCGCCAIRKAAAAARCGCDGGLKRFQLQRWRVTGGDELLVIGRRLDGLGVFRDRLELSMLFLQEL